MAEKRLTKRAIADEVHVLFEVHTVLGQNLKNVLDLRREISGHHYPHVGLAKIREAMLDGSLRELMKVERLIDVLKVFVKQIGIGASAKDVELRSD
jgi:hypothetical protein